MAKIECTIEEFIEFFGEKVTNETSNLAKKEKNKRDRCESCFSKAKLQSAHIIHKDEIIRGVLEKYLTDETVVCGDLNMIYNEIIEEHEPILDHFMFLCGKCHKKYDGNQDKNVDTEISPKVSVERIMALRDFSKAYKLSTWAEKPDNQNHQLVLAYLHLSEKENKAISFEDFMNYTCEQYSINSKSFLSTFKSMTTDNGNSHGNVFKEIEDKKVSMHSIIFEETLRYFEK